MTERVYSCQHCGALTLSLSRAIEHNLMSHPTSGGIAPGTSCQGRVTHVAREIAPHLRETLALFAPLEHHQHEGIYWPDGRLESLLQHEAGGCPPVTGWPLLAVNPYRSRAFSN